MRPAVDYKLIWPFGSDPETESEGRLRTPSLMEWTGYNTAPTTASPNCIYTHEFHHPGFTSCSCGAQKPTPPRPRFD